MISIPAQSKRTGDQVDLGTPQKTNPFAGEGKLSQGNTPPSMRLARSKQKAAHVTKSFKAAKEVMEWMLQWRNRLPPPPPLRQHFKQVQQQPKIPNSAANVRDLRQPSSAYQYQEPSTTTCQSSRRKEGTCGKPAVPNNQPLGLNGNMGLRGA